MKKILIIDDKTEPAENSIGLISMADRWRNERVIDNTLVEVTKSPNKYFVWDEAGNNCKALFNIDEYSYIFIHHSQKGDSLLPSNIMDLIKSILSEKLVLFSGGIIEQFLNQDNPDFIFRSIPRKKLWDKFPEFIKKSSVLGEWAIDILFFNYERTLIAKIVQMQEIGIIQSDILDSPEFIKILKLKHVTTDSKKHKEIVLLTDDALIEQLREL